jgi:hypothetical protein
MLRFPLAESIRGSPFMLMLAGKADRPARVLIMIL